MFTAVKQLLFFIVLMHAIMHALTVLSTVALMLQCCIRSSSVRNVLWL